MESKIPLEVTAGDVLKIPVTLVNTTPTEQLVQFSAKGSGTGISVKPSFQLRERIKVPQDERKRVILDAQVNSADESSELVLKASAGILSPCFLINT